MAELSDLHLTDLVYLSEYDAQRDQDIGEHGDMDFDVDGGVASKESIDYDDLDSVAKLQKSQRYADIMLKVENALFKGTDNSHHGTGSQDEHEYQLIADCNALSADIKKEIFTIYNFTRDNYRSKFPDLEKLVPHPVDYCRVVKKIGNEMDMTHVDMEGLVPPAMIMVISLTASAATGKLLSEEKLKKINDACDRVLTLDSANRKILEFIEDRMEHIAPNVSAIIGNVVAAKLIVTAGGLSALKTMSSDNVMLLGSRKKNLAGYSTATSQFRVGYLEQTEIFQSTPESLRNKASRFLAGKTTLAARIDAESGDPTGKKGRDYKECIKKKIEKLQQQPLARQTKPLPVPNSEPKKKRGGRRLRKYKERYAMTDMRKLANRMQFGVPEESSLGNGLGEGYGMLGQAGSGRLRGSVAQSNLSSKAAKRLKENHYGSTGATSGMASSLAFTHVQGIELIDPAAQGNMFCGGTRSTYFSGMGKFSMITKP